MLMEANFLAPTASTHTNFYPDEACAEQRSLEYVPVSQLWARNREQEEVLFGPGVQLMDAAGTHPREPEEEAREDAEIVELVHRMEIDTDAEDAGGVEAGPNGVDVGKGLFRELPQPLLPAPVPPVQETPRPRAGRSKKMWLPRVPASGRRQGRRRFQWHRGHSTS